MWPRPRRIVAGAHGVRGSSFISAVAVVVSTLVLVLLTALPAAAVAASVEVDPAGTLRVRGDDGPDRVVVSPTSATEIGVSVRGGGTLTPGAGCRAVSRRRANCLTDGVQRVLVELAGGDDRVNLGLVALPAELDGGQGDDDLRGGQGPDVLTGGPGRDRLNGEAGDDRLDGGLGPDELRGGQGVDTVSYDDAARTIGVKASIPEPGRRAARDDGSDEDGPDGAGDRIFSTVENLVGTRLADKLTGNSVANLLRGGEGSDRVAGGDGDDAVELADGGTGDSGDCGPGADTAAIDQGEDAALTGCETVQAQPVGARATLEGRWRSAALGVDVFITRSGAGFRGVVAAATGSEDPACFPLGTVFFELTYDLAANAYTGTGLGAPGTAATCRNGIAPVRINPSEDDRFQALGDAASDTWDRAAIADGVTYRAVDDPVGPVAVRVTTVDPAAATTLDTALAEDRLGGLERTSAIAARRQAVVAVNGDYFVRATGAGGAAFRPVHPYAEDGRLIMTPGLTDFSFAMNPSETATFIGRTNLSATAQPDGAAASPIQRVNNGPPTGDEVAAFTAEGAVLASPPAAGCGARIAPTGPPALVPGAGVRAPASVSEVRCDTPMLPEGDTGVLAASAGGAGAAFLGSLVPGQPLTFGWALRGPPPATGVFDTLDVIGGTPLLVSNGAARPCNDGSAFCGLNPRTGVGVTADGHLLLVTVDGRQPGASVGMTITQFARLFVSLGARFALNFDGGGSTSMVVDGILMNRPSDPAERPISTALLVLPGADPGQTPTGERPATARQSAKDQTATWEAVIKDPGSTGGLAEQLQAAGRPLPPELATAAGAAAP